MGFILSSICLSQNQPIADSLVQVLKNHPPDSIIDSLIWQIATKNTDVDSILHYSNQLIKRSSQDLWLYRGYYNKGLAYKRKGELELALSSVFTAEKYARKINRPATVGTCLISIGDIYGMNGNRNNSILYYNKAISVFRELNDSIPLASALLNAGDEYFNYGKLDSALIYFEESGEIFRRQDFELGNAYNLGNVGMVYAKQGQHELAEANMKTAIAILEKFHDLYPIAVYDTYMADIYLERGDISRALTYARHSLQISEEEGLKEQIRDANLKLAELYGLQQDYHNAYKHQTQYIAYRDSINSEETIQKMADLRTEYEVSQKQVEVDLLEQQKRTQQVIGLALIIVLVLIIVLAILIYRTSTQRKTVNAQLAAQKKTLESQRDQLESLNKTKDRFFSIISHDLRGPVNAFTGIAGLIRSYIEEEAYSELVETTAHIDQSASQLSALLDNLLSWAISQQGEFPYRPEYVNLAAIGNELQGVFKNTSLSKTIDMVIDIAPEVSVWADKNSTMTILRNLVSNALKFTESGGRVVLSAKSIQDKVHVSVKDTGVGISEDRMKTLFQLQDKKSTWGTDGEKGLGLGLQLAYEFTAMNKGTITVKSQVDKGTTFTIALPASPL